ncbi:MAG: hypothetical protein ACFNKE_09750, partial [Neisseria elongata]
HHADLTHGGVLTESFEQTLPEAANKHRPSENPASVRKQGFCEAKTELPLGSRVSAKLKRAQRVSVKLKPCFRQKAGFLRNSNNFSDKNRRCCGIPIKPLPLPQTLPSNRNQPFQTASDALPPLPPIRKENQ